MSTDATTKCEYCGDPLHQGMCPRIKAVEYHDGPNGAMIRREFWELPVSQDKWQPMATIPKGELDEDGDRLGPIVLVWLEEAGHPWIARWVERDGEPGHICSTYSESMDSWIVDLDSHPDPKYHPSLWMLWRNPSCE